MHARGLRGIGTSSWFIQQQHAAGKVRKRIKQRGNPPGRISIFGRVGYSYSYSCSCLLGVKRSACTRGHQAAAAAAASAAASSYVRTQNLCVSSAAQPPKQKPCIYWGFAACCARVSSKCMPRRPSLSHTTQQTRLDRPKQAKPCKQQPSHTFAPPCPSLHHIQKNIKCDPLLFTHLGRPWGPTTGCTHLIYVRLLSDFGLHLGHWLVSSDYDLEVRSVQGLDVDGEGRAAGVSRRRRRRPGFLPAAAAAPL